MALVLHEPLEEGDVILSIDRLGEDGVAKGRAIDRDAMVDEPLEGVPSRKVPFEFAGEEGIEDDLLKGLLEELGGEVVREALDQEVEDVDIVLPEETQEARQEDVLRVRKALEQELQRLKAASDYGALEMNFSEHLGSLLLDPLDATDARPIEELVDVLLQ